MGDIIRDPLAICAARSLWWARRAAAEKVKLNANLWSKNAQDWAARAKRFKEGTATAQDRAYLDHVWRV